MKKKIMFGLICLLSLTTFVNAEEITDYIIKDGALYVNAPVPKSQDELSNIPSVLNEQYKEYLQDDETSYNKSLSLVDCSEDYSTCTLITSGCKVNDGCGDIPTEGVQIRWQENYSEEFKKIAPNNVLEINAIKPTTKAEMDAYLYYYILNLYPDTTIVGELDGCNQDKSECNLTLHSDLDDVNYNKEETHKVKVKWQESNSEIKALIDSYVKKIESIRNTSNEDISFEITGLSRINFMNNITTKNGFIDSNKAANYSKDLKKIFENSNITYYLALERGVMEPMVEYGAGSLILSYNGIMYGSVNNVGIQHKNVIYIPDETENTKEAYIAAAKKRIDDYLGNTDTKIEVAGKREGYISGNDTELDFSLLGDESKMGDYFYSITVGNVTDLFVIIRDSSKIEKPTYETKDIKTNVSISSTSSEVPLDTVIKVEVVDTISEVFTKINEVLKLDKKEEVQVYDIKLFSESSNKYITKLSNGEFKVSVPIKESLKGKELVAYYVTENNKIEEHDVTVVDGIATFTTNHFSVYTIAEKKEVEDPLNEQIPSTFDSIMNYVIVGVVGLIGLSTTVILKKREN